MVYARYRLRIRILWRQIFQLCNKLAYSGCSGPFPYLSMRSGFFCSYLSMGSGLLFSSRFLYSSRGILTQMISMGKPGKIQTGDHIPWWEKLNHFYPSPQPIPGISLSKKGTFHLSSICFLGTGPFCHLASSNYTCLWHIVGIAGKFTVISV